MKNLLYLILVILSVAIMADEFDPEQDEFNDFDNNIKISNTLEISPKQDVINTQEIKNNIVEIKNKIIEFYNLLPLIEGRIISLPKAGTIDIKFSKDKINIHEGMKLVAKRKGIESPLTGDGILYLKYNKYKKLVGRYTRSQVGKFEINDMLSSKWYTPTIVVANFNDKINANQELTSILRNTLASVCKKDKKIHFKNSKKINTILNKMLTTGNKNRQMKRLFGQGVDYVLFGSLKKDSSSTTGSILNIDIISTYTNKVIFTIKINTKLWFLFF